jgi:hypothetical protein
MAFLHFSSIGVIEIYNIFQETDGSIKMVLIQNRGPSAQIGKSSVMIGNCSNAIFED